MAVTAATTFARALVALAASGMAGTASAQDPIAGALLGAGAGAIIGHTVGGPDAAVVGGIIGAVTGAAVTSSSAPGRAVHYRGGYGYAPPPVYYPMPPRGPVYVVPPPAIVFIPGHGHGFWHHGVDAWGRPLRTWVPAPRPRGYYAPPSRPRHHYPGYRDGRRHRPGW